MGKSEETKKMIIKLAKKEFLEKGFKDASARNIAKTGNITTGAIYRYFPNNESLFAAIVEPTANNLITLYSNTQGKFLGSNSEHERKNLIASDDDEFSKRMLDYIYDNMDVFRLIVLCSAGTEYAGYIDRLTDISVKNTRRFIEALHADGVPVNNVSDYAIRSLCHNNMVSFFEIVGQEIPREDALEYIKEIFQFYNAGWKALLGLRAN